MEGLLFARPCQTLGKQGCGDVVSAFTNFHMKIINVQCKTGYAGDVQDRVLEDRRELSSESGQWKVKENALRRRHVE